MKTTARGLAVAGTALLALAVPATAHAQSTGIDLPVPARAPTASAPARASPIVDAEDVAPEPEPPPRRPLKVLVTGFGPFGSVTFNPSWEEARRLDGQTIDGASVVARQLPVVWDRAAVELADHIREHRPDVVICTGVAEGEDGLRLERIARNENRGIADNDGVRLSGEDIPGAADTYDSRLPLERIAAALEEAGIPRRYSDDAGGYLCNQTFFRVSHMSATGEVGPDVRQRDRHGGRRRRELQQQEPLPAGALPPTVGFVHVPGVEEDDSSWGSGLPMDEIARGVRICVEATVAQVQQERAAEAEAETAIEAEPDTEADPDAEADAEPEAEAETETDTEADTETEPAIVDTTTIEADLDGLLIGADRIAESIARALRDLPRAEPADLAPDAPAGPPVAVPTVPRDGFADVMAEEAGE